MQVVGVILLLISVGTVVGPIGAVAYTYKDNLIEMVVPTQINDIVNGNGTDNSRILMPVFVGAQVDGIARTFTVTVNFTNTFNYDLTVNSLTAQVVCNEHNYPLGNINIPSVVSVLAGQTAQIAVSGSWTPDAENHILTLHQGATSIDANLVNLTISVNGITIQQPGPILVGNVPIT